jgi:hypothetical protein
VKTFGLILFSIISLTAQGQNSHFDSIWNFEFYNNNFFLDKEYYNLIADAYTLAGHKINSGISVRIAGKWKLYGGADLYKFWGDGAKIEIIPVFYIAYKDNNRTFRMGNLNRENNHKMLRPLYDPESAYLPQKTETGLQYIYNDEKNEWELWLDWHRFIRKKDTFRERINLGGRMDYTVARFGRWEWHLPLQFLIHHRGGQINMKGKYMQGKNATFSILTGAAGLTALYRMTGRHHLHFFVYGLTYLTNSSSPEELIYPSGHAAYAGANWFTDNWQAGFAYWYADRFNAPSGEDIFQTVSRKIERYFDDNGEILPVFTGHTESPRILWILSGGFYHNFSQNLTFSAKANIFFQPYYSDIPNRGFIKPVENHADMFILFRISYLFHHQLKNLQ